MKPSPQRKARAILSSGTPAPGSRLQLEKEAPPQSKSRAILSGTPAAGDQQGTAMDVLQRDSAAISLPQAVLSGAPAVCAEQGSANMDQSAVLPKDLVDVFLKLMKKMTLSPAEQSHEEVIMPSLSATNAPIIGLTTAHEDIAALSKQEDPLRSRGPATHSVDTAPVTPILCTDRQLLDQGLVRIDDPTVQAALIKAQEAYEQGAAHLKFALRAKQRAALKTKESPNAAGHAPSPKTEKEKCKKGKPKQDHVITPELDASDTEDSEGDGRHQ